MGRDSHLEDFIKDRIRFQPTRPHGARQEDDDGNVIRFTFQPTRPHGARPSQPPTPSRCRSFNPRARMGRDLQEREQFIKDNAVSTHAPAWGATQPPPLLATAPRVSTHAPAWGATGFKVIIEAGWMFQPTRPHGARLHYDEEEFVLYEFQPTRPHGARRFPMRVTKLPARFQPTRPHGARHG